jgi:hypothetical protein
MLKKITHATLLLPLLIILLVPGVVSAAGEGIDFTTPPAGTIEDAGGVLRAISRITDWIFSIFLLIAVIMILISAFNLLMSGGNGEKYESAKKGFKFAIIAIVLAVLSKSMVILAARIAGVTGISFPS